MPWALPDADPDILALAKAYPFESPPGSYLFAQGRAAPLGEVGPAAFVGRTPVIAHGSNRAPAQLLRKFGETAEIPVTRGWLADFDVVYSAHVTRYGSIAADLRHAPGVRASVFVTWLTEAQLTRMHETELGGENYRYGVLERIDLELEAGPSGGLREAHVYLSVRGCIAGDGAPLSLAAVEAQGRDHGRGPSALAQAEVQEVLRGRHRAHEDLDPFILANVRDAARRRALIAEMVAQSLAPTAPAFRELLR
jgi:hypothetical protein